MYIHHRRRHRSLVALAAVGAVGALAPVAAGLPAGAHGESPPICYPIETRPLGANTYGDPRGGGTRSHQGHDIMGPKMVPMQAAVDGVVEEIIHNNSAGNRIAIRGPEGWRYVYLHVNNDTPGTDDGAADRNQVFAPGLVVGSQVRAGQVIAFNGDSGNSENSGAHLHFEIRRPGAGHWSLSPSIDPYPSLQAAPNCSGADDPARYRPFTDAVSLVERQYADLLGRPADPVGLSYWASQVRFGYVPAYGVAETLLGSTEAAQRTAPVARLYWAFFLRTPDSVGLQYWLDQFRGGMPLADIAQWFATSDELQARYSVLNDAAFVNLVYRNILDREALPVDRIFWTTALSSRAQTRGQVMLQFSESSEYVTRMAEPVDITTAYIGMLGRAPDPDALASWLGQDRTALVRGIFDSPEYAARITGG
ncbi:MAG: DUF4214 domain-containing protein [Acidimicrobiia bacterium]|nr:DUF4214 domain-containing protein [Acidimicrobiia bacterium]